MQSLKNILKSKTFIVAVSFLLVMALAACIFGMEYASVLSEKENAVSERDAVISERDALASENDANKAKVNEQNSKLNDLNSKVDKLESENAYIKATKAKLASSKKASTANSSDKATEKIDTSNLTAPNDGYKVCYLTFDDGPSDNTLKILDILKRANAKASFFVVGTSKLSYIKRAKDEGHTIALHTNSHDFKTVYKSESDYFKDLNSISNKVENLIGEAPKIMRFPGGSSNTVSKKYCKGIMTKLTRQVQSKGYVYVDWNVDSGDASGNNIAASKLVSNIKANSKGKGDICVLMHDTGAKKTTVEALPQIISYLRSQGYKFEALTTDSPAFHHGVNN